MTFLLLIACKLKLRMRKAPCFIVAESQMRSFSRDGVAPKITCFSVIHSLKQSIIVEPEEPGSQATSGALLGDK
jgi:hypothetical protein